MFRLKYFKSWVLALVLINFILRLVIYYNTSLFITGVSKVHIEVIEKIAEGQHVSLSSGNFLFAVSYIGFFFKYILGNLNYFFIFNSILGSAVSLIISLLVLRITLNRSATVVTLIILSLYTEFMVFSSVFYTPVISLFLLTLLLLILFYYYNSEHLRSDILYAGLSAFIVCVSFYFKQELIFLPFFLIALMIILRNNKQFFKKTLILSAVLGITTIFFYRSGIFIERDRDGLANDFIFFGHTDYGGDLGEGAFIYPANEQRYIAAFNKYCIENNIKTPDRTQIDDFQRQEIIQFITRHPIKWVQVQLTKFFRTFGVVPEGTSFKVLYTGLFKGNLWLTSIVVVAPVAIIIILFILLFNLQAVRQLIRRQASGDGLQAPGNSPCEIAQSKHLSIISQGKYPAPSTRHLVGFLSVYLLLFIYYLIATIFFGQYQERYRIPLIVVFIIPALAYFIATFNKQQFLKKISLMIKGIIIILFLTIWTFQAEKAISNKGRLNNAIESVKLIKPGA